MSTRSQHEVQSWERVGLDREVACSCGAGVGGVIGARCGLDLLLAERGALAHPGWRGTEERAKAAQQRNCSPDRLQPPWVAHQPVPTLAKMTTRSTTRRTRLIASGWARVVISTAARGAHESSRSAEQGGHGQGHGDV